MKIERRDFLVEVGTEELPPKALRGLEEAFAAGLQTGLSKVGLTHGDVISFATPRRLAVWVKELASRQPDQDIRRKGPPVATAFDASGQPTRAAIAFAEKCGTSVEALQRVDEANGTFLYFIGVKPGAAVTELLPDLVRSALDALPIPRRMHWGAGNAEFVRPAHWLVMLYGQDVVPATLLDTASGDVTTGHRFHAPKPIRLASPGAYESALREHGHVLADFAARRETIRERVNAVGAENGGRALISDALLDEVTALVEWPVPLAGRFEERFLSLPREVLISTLQDHQRYFPVEDTEGKLMPWFITVSNIESRDPAKVRQGNERVVRPRLADAAFFWEQDRKQPLAARREGLDAVTFQAKLGSLGDKTRRIRTLAGEIASATDAVQAEAQRAAELCKCDLLTSIVGEFPELQGVMGTYYARADGEASQVAEAIREHYLPRGAGDELPGTPAGVAVAIADKLDTLAGIFAIGEKPTGTKDPFGLRRAAIGVLRILIEKRLELNLRHFIERAVELARTDIERIRGTAAGAGGSAAATEKSATAADGAATQRGTAASSGNAQQKPVAGARDKTAPAPIDPARIATEVYDYVMERLRAYYLERSGAGSGTAATAGTGPAATASSRSATPTPIGAAAITTEMFDAVLATKPVSPLDFDARLKALSAFLDLPEAGSLTAANKRIANILRKAGESPPADVDVGTLRDSAEVRLFDSMRALRDAVSAATARKEYANALGRLAQLRPAVDAFFDEVMVMDEDPRLRANRLALLAQMHGLFAGVADLSRLPG